MNEPTNIIDLAAALQASLSAEKDSTKAKARAMWDGFSDNERTMVRIGVFPAGKMHEAAREGFDQHKLVVALMEIASRNGGMIA